MEARMKIVENANFAGYKPPGLTELLQEFHFTYGHDKLPRDKAEIPLWKRVICGPNQWPAEFELPGFRAALLAHRDACDSLNKVLQRSTAEMLGLDPSTFDKYFWGPNGEKNGFVSTRVLHYTPMAEADPERVARLARAEGGDPLSLGSHRDGTAFFTLLINDGPGLEVSHKDSKSFFTLLINWSPYIGIKSCRTMDPGSSESRAHHRQHRHAAHVAHGRLLARYHAPVGFARSSSTQWISNSSPFCTA